MDGYHANRIVGTRALCAALERACDAAAAEGFGLLLWDGYRPQRAVEDFMRWSALPEDGRTKARHYPNSAWIALHRDVFERLCAYKRRQGLATWEQVIEQLLPASTPNGQAGPDRS